MKISSIKFNNFRIYRGENEIRFTPSSEKNINIIAGKNGFGKTTFLTSLIWVFYGKMMVEVEEKYKRDIRNAGGYEKFLITLLNRDVKSDFELHPAAARSRILSIEIEVRNLSIPSIPCESVVIKRSFDIKTGKEDLEIRIDGLENELTKEVGYEVFINDFILPREIAKFFFFDAEKIVTLAEAKSKIELKNLSRAYSEVLGIKKYEDLKRNLETIVVKLRRNGAKPEEQIKLGHLLETENQLLSLIELNKEESLNLDAEVLSLTKQSETLQEKLIREGNGITVDELQELKNQQKKLKLESEEVRSRLKKMLDIVPLVIAGKKLFELNKQLEQEHAANVEVKIDNAALSNIKELFIEKLKALNINSSKSEKIFDVFQQSIEEHRAQNDDNEKILLDYNAEQYRAFKAVIYNIKNGFNNQFKNIVQEEKNNRLALSKVLYKIKQAEVRKDNPLAQKLRDDKIKIDQKIIQLSQEKGRVMEELNNLETKLTSNLKVLSEYEKKFKLLESDRAKLEVTENLLDKINIIIQRIKEDKKYSLQKSILLGLKKIMHKSNFVQNVRVNVYDEVMDIDLLDKNDTIIDKESMSKGEQQLYATALLKALVDESGIKFPVFIDSPLQKFDKFHSQNIIREFYPSISEQVVLFPLLEKELSEIEYDFLKPYVNKVFIIESLDGASKFRPLKVDDLFNEVKNEENVYTN
jgi:DNA sulfur modification protein DndD